MIAVGDRIPQTGVKLVNKSGPLDADSAVVLGSGTIVLFSLPGAFTPTCHTNHLPGYIDNADALKSFGVDRIICLTVNDHHVVRAWAEATGALDKIEFIADGNADLTRALGLDKDMHASHMGIRAVRAALVVKDGIVRNVFTEAKPGQVTSSGAPAIVEALGAAQSVSSA